MELWKQISLDAPRLRYLELRVHLARMHAANAGWLVSALFSSCHGTMPDYTTLSFPKDNIPGALASLPLVGMRLHLSEMPGVDLQMIREGQWHLLDHPSCRPSMPLAKKLYKAQAGTAKSLPRRPADAIPSLRVVAIADGQSDLDYDGTPPFASPRGAMEKAQSHASSYLWTARQHG